MAEKQENVNTVNLRNEAGASLQIYMNGGIVERRVVNRGMSGGCGQEVDPETAAASRGSGINTTTGRYYNSELGGTEGWVMNTGQEVSGNLSQETSPSWMRATPSRWPTQYLNLLVRET